MAQFLVTSRADGAGCVRLIGEIDIAVTDELLETVRSTLAIADRVDLDCGEVTFIDSSGLGALVLVHREAMASKKRLALLDLSDAMMRLIRLTGLDNALDILAPE